MCHGSFFCFQLIIINQATSHLDPLCCRTVEDVLAENQELKAEVKWLNDVITNNISELSKMINKNGDDISNVQSTLVTTMDKVQVNTDNLVINNGNIADNTKNINDIAKEGGFFKPFLKIQ